MLLYCLHIAHVLKWNSDISYTCSLFKMASFRKRNVENYPSKYATIVWSYLVIRLFLFMINVLGSCFCFNVKLKWMNVSKGSNWIDTIPSEILTKSSSTNPYERKLISILRAMQIFVISLSLKLTNRTNSNCFVFWIFSAMQQNKKPNANIILFIGVIMAFIGAEMIKDGQRRRKKAN